MDTYGDSIHGASGSPFAWQPGWGTITKKQGKLFAHVFNWPTAATGASTTTLQIPAVHNAIRRIYLMSSPSDELTYTVNNGKINVTMPATAPDSNDSVVCVEVDGMPAVIPDGIYTLTSKHSDMALDNANTFADGAQVIQWQANGQPQQQWRVTNLEHGHYRLVCRRSSKALDADNGTEGSAVVQRSINDDAKEQQWNIAALGNDEYTLKNVSSKLSLDNDRRSAHGPVVQRATSSGDQQRWIMTRSD
jgi:hypothetical protein